MQERPSAGEPDRLAPQHVQDDRYHFALVGRDRRHRRHSVPESQNAVLPLESSSMSGVHGLFSSVARADGWSRIRATAPAVFAAAARDLLVRRL
jgi:hypothetical protein